MNAGPGGANALLGRLGALVFERGWLSSNNILFPRGPRGASLVDTGYVAHASQTVELVAQALGCDGLADIVNTHLHSDHCGGNAALQARWGCRIWVPEPSVAAVREWDPQRLSFEYTDQECPRFVLHGPLRTGGRVELGGHAWDILPAGGHDPDAVMFFQPEAGVLLSGDALWESRVAILFPELVGAPGFGPALSTLDLVERLSPRLVIPGHGAPFQDVERALAASRRRLGSYAASPLSHHLHAARALVMFRMLDVRSVDEFDLTAWLSRTRVFLDIARRCEVPVTDMGAFAGDILERLVHTQALRRDGARLRLGGNS